MISGDTVNMAARMEQSGVSGKINISQHIRISKISSLRTNGKLTKNKGEIDMYFGVR
jgi:hypothetical protein